MTQELRSTFDFERWDEMVYRNCKVCGDRKSMPKHREVCVDCFTSEDYDESEQKG